jgi:hypothetical protein
MFALGNRCGSNAAFGLLILRQVVTSAAAAALPAARPLR